MPRAKYKKRADGRYLVQLKNGRKPDGRVRYKNIYGRTEAEVDKKILEFRNQQKTIGVVLTERDTLKELTKIWFDSKYPNGDDTAPEEYGTYAMYSSIIKNHKNTSEISMEPAKKILTEDLQRLIKGIVKSGTPRTAAIAKDTLSQVFRLGVDWNKLLYNPAEKIILKKYKSPPKRTTTELEEIAILKAELSEKERAFVYLGLFAGLRRGESLALIFSGNKKDIDLNLNQISITKDIIIKNNEGIIKPMPKSDAGYRTNPIISPLHDALCACVKTDHHSNYLFETCKGRIATQSFYSKMWKSIIRKLNAAVATEEEPEPITDLTSHILRHTFATYLAVIGINPQIVQRLMGHASIQMTMDVYTHLPLYHRYNDSPIVHFYRELLENSKKVKTMKHKIRTIKKSFNSD